MSLATSLPAALRPKVLALPPDHGNAVYYLGLEDVNVAKLVELARESIDASCSGEESIMLGLAVLSGLRCVNTETVFTGVRACFEIARYG